ncbi:GLIPR1-like protein 1 [Perognathus longimembris pacificus]|uniref:GLIPR1-like protein 1 n=1 Tax=Perognathus longimembris pacificus TaxID=214514 RepID=UPI002018C00B|nr:GLIPR1-like protein 1 [Perognathus longimembris pacificus]
MALKTFSCLWTLSFFLLVASKSNIELSTTDSDFIDQCIKAHNDFRSRVKPPAADMQYLTWDADLARLAKEWSTQCKLQNNPCTTKPYQCFEDYEYVGENLWIGGIKEFTPKTAVTFWHNESKFYDIDMLSCSQVCGHYTQVIWANTNHIGCAISTCPNLGGASISLFVCNYGPAGNFANKPPYVKGKSCLLCQKGQKCVKRLCSKQQLLIIITIFCLEYPEKMMKSKASQRTTECLYVAEEALSLNLLPQYCDGCYYKHVPPHPVLEDDVNGDEKLYTWGYGWGTKSTRKKICTFSVWVKLKISHLKIQVFPFVWTFIRSFFRVARALALPGAFSRAPTHFPYEDGRMEVAVYGPAGTP